MHSSVTETPYRSFDKSLEIFWLPSKRLLSSIIPTMFLFPAILWDTTSLQILLWFWCFFRELPWEQSTTRVWLRFLSARDLIAFSTFLGSQFGELFPPRKTRCPMGLPLV